MSFEILLPVGLATLAAGQSYEPITTKGRIEWFAVSSFGPASLAGGVVSAGFGAWTNQPKGYGTHWEGFGDRYGMRLTGVVTSNGAEVRSLIVDPLTAGDTW